MDETLADAANVHGILDEDASFADKAADWVSKGIPAAAASGVISVLNTGIAFGNMFGDFEKIDTENKLREYDDNLANYYAEHKEGADVGGFLLTSFVPGTLGMKGLKALQTIKDGGIIGRSTAAITGFASNVEQAAIKKAAETVAGETNLIWGTLNAEKVKAISAGFAEQALQGLAFESGVLLTMNQNPVINPDDRSYFGSIWSNLGQSALNAGVFGAIGGTINAASVLGQIKTLVRKEDLRLFDAKVLDLMGRNTTESGTESVWLYDQIKQREDILANMYKDGTVDAKYLKAYEDSTDYLKTTWRKHVSERVAPGDPELAKIFTEAADLIAPGVENGYLVKASEKLARVLGGAKSIQRIGDIATEAEKTFYQPGRVFTADEMYSRLDDFAAAMGIKVVKDVNPEADFYASRANRTTAMGYPITPEMDAHVLVPERGVNPTFQGKQFMTDVEVYAHELGHQIAFNIPKYFDATTPYSIVRQDIPDFMKLRELSKEFRPGFYRGDLGYGNVVHANKPNEILADSIAMVLLGKSPHEALGHLWKKGGLNLEKMGMTQDDVVDFITQISRTYANRTRVTQRIVKLRGVDKGVIKDVAYPVAGDLGKVEIIKTAKGETKIRINNEDQNINLMYDPSNETPTHSSLQFLQAKLNPAMVEHAEVPMDNLPLLEKAYLEGQAITVSANDGSKMLLQGQEVAQLLAERKMAAIEKLKNEGKDLDYISRATNSPREFMESGQGEMSLSKLEDHTQPLYGKVTYRSVDDINKFFAEGMTAVYERRKEAQTLLDNAAAAVFGPDVFKFDKSKTLVNVTSMPEMAGLLKSIDPAYGSTGSKFAQDGRNVDQIVKQWSTARSDLMHGVQEEIMSDPQRLVEMNVVVAKMRSSDSNWVRLPKEVYLEGEGEFILIKQKILNEVLASKMPQDALSELTDNVAKNNENIIRLTGDSSVGRYLETLQQVNAERVRKFNILNAAKGSNRTLDPNVYYIPPIDTQRQPYFLMVRMKQPLAGEGGENPMSFVVAPNAEALEKKYSLLQKKYGEDLEIFTAKDVKDKKIIDGVFDSGDFFQKTAVDSMLKREGLLTDFVPRTDGYVFQEFDSWLYKQEQALARQGVEALRSEEFAQLRALADNYGELYSSKFGGKTLNDADNPYLQLINVALNVSNKGHYDQYWGALNRGTSAAWNAITSVAKDVFHKSQKGELTAEAANKIVEQHGWRAPYGDVLSEVWNPVIPDPQSLNKLVNKANLAISTLMLRMDALNAVINTISLPILMKSELTSIKRNLADPSVVGKLEALGREQVPGSQHSIPSFAKLLFDGTSNYIKNPDVGIAGINKTMHEYFVEIGAIKTDPQLLRAAMDAVPLTEDAIKSQNGIMAYVSNLTKKVGELGAKYSGNNLAEDFVRFQAAHAMLQVAKTAGITDSAELASYINTYVNRVHGNYLASQRPALFSGPIGQAIGLFQTYQFNMIQQMTRYLQQGDKAAVKAGLALQNTIFGMQGNPLFYQLNNYIGNSNRENRDIVSSVESTLGSPELGAANPARWLLYGLGANSLQMNLYSRGDLTPRYATIVPDRIQDIPLVSIPAKAIGSFLDSMNMINKGAGVPEAILHGVAHSGFNRPLSGLAGLAQGARTTSQGTLLNAYNDIDGFLVASTLAGGRPLNEAVLVDQYYRQQAYASSQTRQLKEVSEAVKLTAAGQKGVLDPDQTEKFLAEYAKKGGDIARANQWLMHATKDSQVSVVNQMKYRYNSRHGKVLRDMMGADDSSIANLDTSSE